MHLSAILQATGEAVYTDDLPHYENELYAGLILSTESHARFTIDSSPLEGMVNKFNLLYKLPINFFDRMKYILLVLMMYQAVTMALDLVKMNRFSEWTLSLVLVKSLPLY